MGDNPHTRTWKASHVVKNYTHIPEVMNTLIEYKTFLDGVVSMAKVGTIPTEIEMVVVYGVPSVAKKLGSNLVGIEDVFEYLLVAESSIQEYRRVVSDYKGNYMK